MFASPRSRAAARRARASLALAATLLLVGATPGSGLVPPAHALGYAILVDTSSDLDDPSDGFCSLREAIIASNGGLYNECVGSASPDVIYFGVSIVHVTSDLPAFTAPVTIQGGSPQVEIKGPGSGTGLTIGGAGGTRISGLKIDGFSIGVSVFTGTTIVGSVIGPNSNSGIYSTTSALVVGGPNGLTPGGACTGDCNVIVGNVSKGLYLSNGGTVQGDHVGIDAAGTAAVPNGVGIVVSSGTWHITGNVVSGNTSDGLGLHSCACTIQGNRIGTDTSGTKKLGNGARGIFSENATAMTLGGSGAGLGNVISGNASHGLELATSTNVSVAGNRIGTNAAGTAALGNGGDGIQIGPTTRSTSVGDGSVAGANVIADSGGVGIRILDTGSYGNTFRVNSIYANAGPGIVVPAFSQNGMVPPTIDATKPIGGSACAGCIVDIYADSADEGRTFLGSATADGSGIWTYPPTAVGGYVTAIATKAVDGSSAFSSPVALPAPTPAPTPTPPATASPAPTTGASAIVVPTSSVGASPAPSDGPGATADAAASGTLVGSPDPGASGQVESSGVPSGEPDVAGAPGTPAGGSDDSPVVVLLILAVLASGAIGLGYVARRRRRGV